LGDCKISGNLCTWLLRYCLIRVDYTDSGNGMAGTYTVYVAVEEVGRLLADPDYLPEGAEVLRQWLLRDR